MSSIFSHSSFLYFSFFLLFFFLFLFPPTRIGFGFGFEISQQEFLGLHVSAYTDLAFGS
jgi:hypothetical protein